MRAQREAVVYEVAEQYRLSFKDFATVVDETHGFRYLEGRAIIGFIDGTENPTNADAPFWAEISDEDPQFVGGSYAFAQKWIHDMDAWRSLGTAEQERAIGREKFTDLELDDDAKAANAHNVSSKFIVDGEENKIVRMNVPFSDPAAGVTGTYFILPLTFLMKLPVAISPRTRPIKLSRNTSSPCIGEKTGEGHLNDAPHLYAALAVTHSPQSARWI